MNKIIKFASISLVVFFTSVIPGVINAQSKTDDQTMEKVFSFWSSTMDQIQMENNVSSKEFDIYNRFYAHQIDSMHGAFIRDVYSGSIGLSTVNNYLAGKKVILNGLFANFRNIEKEFPSSIDEYRIARRPRLGADSCFSSCYNTGFEDGTFDGWYGYYAINNSSTTAYSITGTTGGYLGAVSRGAQDPNTGNTYQLHITSGTATDWFLNNYSTYSMPQVSPYGGTHSVMMGDSVGTGYGVAILSQTFQVPSNSASITYQYALLLENPNHNPYQQPFFIVSVIDQNTGDTIPGCGSYARNATINSSDTGFIPIPYTARTPTDTVWWLNWRIVNVPLSHYAGHCVTINFEVLDCGLGGHFGYAYVDASCTPENVISSSPAICGQDSVSLTAPPGWATYSWTGPSGGILSGAGSQTIWVQDSGTYTVVTGGFAGAGCQDTLTKYIGAAPGPPPVPSFSATTVCAGQPVTFINTSNPIAGTFYWDFYNIGYYQDSLITNPTWSYSSPGTYVVKLYEVNNGCGAYAYDTITVDTTVNANFTYSVTGCAPALVTFSGFGTGATSFFWNFGDTASGTADSSRSQNLFHTFGSPGTYTVYLVAGNGGGCPDTVRQTVIILGPPTAIITGGDSVCAGGVDTLTATGGTSYLWAPGGQTSSTISVSITSATTFTVTVTNSCGSSDTTFVVNLAAPPVANVIASRDTVCPRDTVILTASGGASYIWSVGGQTGSTISVNPITTTNYTVHVFSPGTTCTDSAVITVYITPGITSTITASPDTICSGSSTTLSVNSSGSVTYLWSNGSSGTSITVSPSSSSTYYVVTSGYCTNDTTFKTITILPPPKPVITGSDSVCSGSNDILTATGGSTYIWSTGATTSSITVSGAGTTTYTVIASNGCGSHDTTFTVNISQTPIALLNANSNSICAGDTVLLTAGGGTTYLWNDGLTVTSRTVVLTNTTSYTVHVYNGLGCTDSAVAIINVSQVITSTISVSANPICSGSSATLSVSSSGGPPAYFWSTGSTESTITVSPLTTTTYYVLTSGTCADDSIGQVITVVPTPFVTISYPDTVCIGGATTITATGASNYVWGNGSTANPITVSLTQDSTITVIGSNGSCTDTVRKMIDIYPALVKSPKVFDSVCSGGMVAISVLVSGGHPAYSYAWNNGLTWDSAGPLTVTIPPNQYICTITDACGQKVKDTVKIFIRPAPTASFIISPDSVLGGEFVSFINLTTGASSYYWNLGNGQTSSDSAPFIQYNEPQGTYSVTLYVSNSYGCRDSLTEYLYVLEQISVPNVFTPNGDGINDVFQITAGGIKDFDIQIFNRWGVKVFESNSPNNSWSGRSTSGEWESSGTYYYVIKASDYSNKTYNKDGFVQLIR